MEKMKLSDYFYDLPEGLIAQDPLEKRDESRLLVLGRDTGKIKHQTFKDVIDYLRPNDCLVINNTRVIPARLLGKKEKTDDDKRMIYLLEHDRNYVCEENLAAFLYF